MAHAELNKVFDSHNRLLIALHLYANGTVGFSDLKAAMSLTDGALSNHIKVLEAAGYVAVHKGYKDNRPYTEYTLTAVGKRELKKYAAVIVKLLGGL